MIKGLGGLSLQAPPHGNFAYEFDDRSATPLHAAKMNNNRERKCAENYNKYTQ